MRVDSFHQWDFTYVAGKEGLPAGARIALAVEHGADWGKPGSLSRDKFGGVRVRVDADVELEILKRFVTWGNGIEFSVKRGSVPPGGRVFISIGHPEEEGGSLKAPSIAHDATIRILHNLHGDMDDRGFLLYEEIFPTPIVRTLPYETETVNAIAKSKAYVNETVSVLLRAEDRYGNITPDFTGEFDLFDDESGTKLGEATVTSEDQGCALVEGVRMEDVGVHRLRIVDRLRGWTTYSDPIEISDNRAHPGVVWGQMHGHSLVSDGLGSADEYYEYARTKSNLDFCALTDHGYLTENIMDYTFFRHYIDEETWNEYAAVTRNRNEPGRFVTFLAYEWTSNLYSDKNVYFFNDDEPWEPYPHNYKQLYAKYHGRKCMIISHMMYAVPFMRATNWNEFDPSLERVVEVASVHGVREYPYNPYFPEDTWTEQFGWLMAGHLVIDALKKGHRLGIICGADTHTGCPGNSISGIQPCRINGLMAVRSVELSREAVWEAWYDRRAYGTTGPRILLDVSLAGAPMGSEVRAEEADPREFVIRVYGKLGIERVELIREDPVNPIDRTVFDPPIWNPGTLTLVDLAPPDRETFYYVRVFQKDGHMAWSSPFWVVR